MAVALLEKIFNLALHGRWSMEESRWNVASIHKILVVRNDNVGDVLCSTPAIRALRQKFPYAYIAALVVGYSKDAILGNPDLDEVVIYEKAKHRPDQKRFVSWAKQFHVERRLRQKRFDLAIGMRSRFSWSEAWLVYFSGARYRLGYEPESKPDRKFAFFYNLRVPPPSQDLHEVERTLHLLEQIGASPAEKSLQVWIPEEEKQEVEVFLKKNGIDPQRLMGFHLSSRVPGNRWSWEKFVALATRVTAMEGHSVVLTWGPGDETLARKVHAQAGPNTFLYPTATLKSLAALLARCRAFVTPDGGAMHLATAVGTPTIGLFGKTDPRAWGPWGSGHIALHNGKNAESISVEEVFGALRKGTEL